MQNTIKIRLMTIEKKLVELIPELAKIGIKTSPPELTNTLKGLQRGPKAENIRITVEHITSEWEKEYAEQQKGILNANSKN